MDYAKAEEVSFDPTLRVIRPESRLSTPEAGRLRHAHCANRTRTQRFECQEALEPPISGMEPATAEVPSPQRSQRTRAALDRLNVEAEQEPAASRYQNWYMRNPPPAESPPWIEMRASPDSG